MKSKTRRRSFLKVTGMGIVGATIPAVAATDKKISNVVVITLDDSGFADFAPFGNPAYPAPNIQKIATEEYRLANVRAPGAVCAAALNTLLGGCHSERAALAGDGHDSRTGSMDAKWSASAQILKTRGYKTALFGKWPLRFDEKGGIETGNVTAERQKNPTKRYTEHACAFIKCHKENPFFLCVSHSMPRGALSASRDFENRTGEGLYADMMAEIDWSVGATLKTLRAAGIDEKTLVIFSSDTGPWSTRGDHAGAANAHTQKNWSKKSV